jgi:hypothetical protein
MHVLLEWPACRDYYQSKLSLEWREWMTTRLTAEYFADRTFYQVQVGTVLPLCCRCTAAVLWRHCTARGIPHWCIAFAGAPGRHAGRRVAYHSQSTRCSAPLRCAALCRQGRWWTTPISALQWTSGGQLRGGTWWLNVDWLLAWAALLLRNRLGRQCADPPTCAPTRPCSLAVLLLLLLQ